MALTSAHWLYRPLLCHIWLRTKCHRQRGLVRRGCLRPPEDSDHVFMQRFLCNVWVSECVGRSLSILSPATVSCSLSSTLELWQGLSPGWEEGSLDETDLFHLIWNISPEPFQPLRWLFSLPVWEWTFHSFTEPWHNLPGFFCWCSGMGVFLRGGGGGCQSVQWKVKSLRPRHAANPSSHSRCSGREKHCVNQRDWRGGEDKIHLAFTGRKPFHSSIYL